MLWPQHQAGSCLRVLPPAEMAKMKADIDAMPNGNPNKVVLKRFIGSESVQVSLDKFSRPDMSAGRNGAAAAAIKNEVVLVGLLDRFEIWNPNRYEKSEGGPTRCWLPRPSN